MSEKHIIAVPTAFNIYRVSDETLQATQGLMAQFPAAVVMETLVMRGLAKVVARIKPYDLEEVEKDDDEFPGTSEYEPGVIKKDKEPEKEESLPGPWYEPDEDEHETGGEG